MDVNVLNCQFAKYQLLLALAVKDLRERRGPACTQNALAQELGISRSTLQSIEKGHADPTISTFFSLFRAKGIRTKLLEAILPSRLYCTLTH